AYSDDDTLSKAIQTEPFSYLVKPFQKHDLVTSIEISILNFNKLNPNVNKNLLVKHNEVYKKIEISTIYFIESDKNYLKLYCDDEIYRYRSTISDFLEIVPSTFLQTHKVFIINSKKINGFTTSYIEILEHQIPLSKTFKDEVLKALSM